MIDSDKIADIYKTIFRDMSNRIGLHEYKQLRFLNDFLPEDKKSLIFDGGCGNGRYAIELHKLGYRNIHAIDLFDTLITNDCFTYSKGSIDHIDMPTSSVDFSYSLGVILYIDNPINAIKEFHRTLKSGGVLILSSHTKYSLFTLERIIKRSLGYANHLDGVKFYSVNEYKKMLVDNGFTILDESGFELLYAPLDIWRRARSFKSKMFIGNNKFNMQDRNYLQDNSYIKKLYSNFGYFFMLAARKE